MWLSEIEATEAGGFGTSCLGKKFSAAATTVCWTKVAAIELVIIATATEETISLSCIDNEMYFGLIPAGLFGLVIYCTAGTTSSCPIVPLSCNPHNSAINIGLL